MKTRSQQRTKTKKGGKGERVLSSPPLLPFFSFTVLWGRCSSDKRNVNRPVLWNNNTQRWQADSRWQSFPWLSHAGEGIKNEPAPVLPAWPTSAFGRALTHARESWKTNNTNSSMPWWLFCRQKHRAWPLPQTTCALVPFVISDSKERDYTVSTPASQLVLITGKHPAKARPHQSIRGLTWSAETGTKHMFAQTQSQQQQRVEIRAADKKDVSSFSSEGGKSRGVSLQARENHWTTVRSSGMVSPTPVGTGWGKHIDYEMLLEIMNIQVEYILRI